MLLLKKSVQILALVAAGLLVTSMAVSAETKRTGLRVGNLSCSSCLANIEAGLKSLPGALGMDADLRSGLVVVDHNPDLAYEQIAAAISSLGYPARVDWTGTLPEQSQTNSFGRTRYSSNCGSGGCGSSGAAAGPVAWKSPNDADGSITRTILQVGNLSCTSCLANIQAELQGMAGTIGMNGFLNRGMVVVDHENSTPGKAIAAAISGLGYPAKVLSASQLASFKATQANTTNAIPVRTSGRGCNGTSGPCNATADSWKTLYKRYFAK